MSQTQLKTLLLGGSVYDLRMWFRSLLIKSARSSAKYKFENLAELAEVISKSSQLFYVSRPVHMYYLERMFAGEFHCPKEISQLILDAAFANDFSRAAMTELEDVQSVLHSSIEPIDQVLFRQLRAKHVVVVEPVVIGEMHRPWSSTLNGIMIYMMLHDDCHYTFAVDSEVAFDFCLEAIADKLERYWLNIDQTKTQKPFIRAQMHKLIEKRLHMRVLPSSLCIFPTIAFDPELFDQFDLFTLDQVPNEGLGNGTETIVLRLNTISRRQWVRNILPLVRQPISPLQRKVVHERINKFL